MRSCVVFIDGDLAYIKSTMKMQVCRIVIDILLSIAFILIFASSYLKQLVSQDWVLKV